MVQVLYWWYFSSLVQNLNYCHLYSWLEFIIGWGHALGWALTASILIAGIVFRWLFIKDKFFFNVIIIIIDFSFSHLNGLSLFLDSRLSNSLDFALQGKLFVITLIHVHKIWRAVEFRENDFERSLLVVFVSKLEILFGLGCLSKMKFTWISSSMIN